jgi:hypothetical protein
MAYKKSPFKMSGKSPFMKALVGKQGNLPMHLQEEIKASPAKQTKSQLEEYRSQSDYLNPKVKRRKNVSDEQVIKEIESQESTMGRAKFKTKADVKAVKSMQALGGGSKYDDLIEQKAIERFKKSPVKQKAGYVKHKTLTVKGKPLEYNPKFDPKKLITDQSEARDKKSLKKKSPAKQKDIKIKDLPDEAVKTGKKIVKGVKKLGKKIGNIKISTKEGQKRRQERRDLRAKQKAEKDSPAKKYGKSPAKKKGCSKKY